jgi:hypothetical protein
MQERSSPPTSAREWAAIIHLPQYPTIGYPIGFLGELTKGAAASLQPDANSAATMVNRSSLLALMTPTTKPLSC